MPPVQRLFYELDIDQVRRIVYGLDAALEPTGFSRLTGGSKEVYRIDLAGRAEPIVLKLYGDTPEWAPAKEALVAGWFDRDLGVPIPRWLAVDESRTLLPLRFALMTWLPGRNLRSLIAEPDIESAYRQMGELLRRVHAIPMSAYGYIRGAGIHDGRPTNADYVIATFERSFRWFRRQGGDEGLAKRMEQGAEARFGLLAHSAGPVLCHDDFQPGNVLGARGDDGALHLTGLIDFGNALAGDALSDLAKALFCSAHEDTRSYAPLLEGYGPIDHSDPAEALWLYTLFHRLIMWNWLVRLGDDPGSESLAGLLRDLDQMVR